MNLKLRADLQKQSEMGDRQAQYLMAIALHLLEAHVQGNTTEEFAKRYGTYGTEALAKYTT